MSVTSIKPSVMIMDIKYTLTEAIQCQRKVCAVYSTEESRKVLNDLEDLLSELEKVNGDTVLNNVEGQPRRVGKASTTSEF